MKHDITLARNCNIFSSVTSKCPKGLKKFCSARGGAVLKEKDIPQVHNMSKFLKNGYNEFGPEFIQYVTWIRIQTHFDSMLAAPQMIDDIHTEVMIVEAVEVGSDGDALRDSIVGFPYD